MNTSIYLSIGNNQQTPIYYWLKQYVLNELRIWIQMVLRIPTWEFRRSRDSWGEFEGFVFVCFGEEVLKSAAFHSLFGAYIKDQGRVVDS